jgi:hypothetical protein
MITAVAAQSSSAKSANAVPPIRVGSALPNRLFFETPDETRCRRPPSEPGQPRARPVLAVIAAELFGIVFRGVSVRIHGGAPIAKIA